MSAADPEAGAALPRTRRASGGVRFGARSALAAAAIALAAVPFGLLLVAVRTAWEPLLRVDRGASEALNAFAVGHEGFVDVLRALSTIGSIAVYGPLLALVAAWLAWRRVPRLAVFVVVTGAGGPLLNATFKALVDRARPVLADPVARADGLSFPSGHAQSAVVVGAVLLLVFLPVLRGPWRMVSLGVALAWAAAVGFARVGLGVHFVSDVLAGYVLGAAWVAATTAAFSAWRRERGRPAVQPQEGLEPEHRGQIGTIA